MYRPVFPYDGKVYAASLVKAHTSLPVICVGNIFAGDEGEAILKEGLADMIAVGRGSLVDPAWAILACAANTACGTWMGRYALQEGRKTKNIGHKAIITVVKRGYELDEPPPLPRTRK